jgi:hypothetical protein
MIKSELVQLAEKNPHLHRTVLEKIVNAVLDQIESALAQRNRVEVRGFGVFSPSPSSPGVKPRPLFSQLFTAFALTRVRSSDFCFGCSLADEVGSPRAHVGHCCSIRIP